jgi:enoyl-CoA hydratase/carnithine racemase
METTETVSEQRYETLQLALADRILTVTLNRPERLNAFTIQMAQELIDLFERVGDDDAVRVVVVTGAGRAFCAGMDLGDCEGNVFGLDESLTPSLVEINARYDDPEIMHGLRDTGGRLTLAIYDCKKPVIAAVNGVAVGIGATMTLAMDVRFASDKARFGFVFGKIGIVPDACSSWFLPKVVGIAKALEWTYSAEIFGAAEALRCNLVREVVPADQLLEAAYKLARIIANERSPVSTALIRQMMYRNSGEPHPRQAHVIESLGVFHASTHDGREGVQAFRDKRAPMFQEEASRMPGFYPWWDARGEKLE